MSTSALDRFRRVDALFDTALDQPSEERRAFVERLAGDDHELGREVLRLLRAHELSTGFLGDPAVRVAAPLFPDGDPLASTGAPPPGRVGPFRVVREIGRGGMGAVYLGEREDGQFEQRVALKLVRYAGTYEGLVRRFLEERRILALLEHPGIARLLDGGVTAEGLPYFAMEYVEGDPIDEYCDSRSLPLAARLELFGRACDAVQYAHQHLVVHRDLKPGNMLVTADGQLKLLDFGIARLLSAISTEEEVSATVTAFQAMTPEYASPEQVRGEPVSTATDVYALGVLLYRLLTGERPYDVRNRSPAEVERTICEAEPPPPSSTFARAERAGARTAEDRARARSATPERLQRRLKGDLDLIVLKALRKEPDHRYASAAALKEDLDRYLTGLPIAARPESRTYRLRKFVGRNRRAVGFAAVLLLLLVGTAFRERTLRGVAEAETRKARAVEEYLVSVFDVADPFATSAVASADVTARVLLDRGATRIDELDDDPALRADLRGVFGRVYTSLGLYGEAEAQLRRSLEERRRLYGEHHPAVAETMDQLGLALLRQDRLDEAEPLLRAALAERRRSGARDPRATARTLDRLATLLQERNDFDAAEPLFREAVSILQDELGEDHVSVVTQANNLALLLWRKGGFAEADSIYRRSLAVLEERLGEDHPHTAVTVQNLAQATQMLGNAAEAESLYRRALTAKRGILGDAHPSVTISLNNLGRMLAGEGRPDEAEPLIREALALDRQIFGDRHSYVAQSLGNLGFVLAARGEFAEAERVHREALAINRAVLGDEHVYVALNLNDIATAIYMMGDAAAAVPLYRQSAERFTRLLGAEHSNPLAVTNNLARALRDAGSTEEAERLFRSVDEKLDPSLPEHRSTVFGARQGLGQTLVAQGRVREARSLLESAVELGREQFGPEHWRTAAAEAALGECLTRLGEFESAEPLLRRANDILQKQSRGQPRLAAQAAAALERLQLAMRKPG